MSGRSAPLPRLQVAAARYRFRESLFLLPTLVVVGGVALAEVCAVIDRELRRGAALPLALDITSNAATWLLSTVAGAMITTAGVVFSLTVVSLQLASSQFSPRVMRSFIRDRLSQLVIGLLVATFVYCVLTLRQIGADEAQPAPPVSMTVAAVLTVGTVVLIIAHLDHLARGLQVGEVARSIAGEGEQIIAAMVEQARDETPAPSGAGHHRGQGFEVAAPHDGWVTQAAADRMLAVVPPGSTLRLETRSGAYIHEGEPLLTVWPAPADPGRVRSRLSATVMVAAGRTMQQDVDFALRQLADIGLRALSSAINDPTTAVEVTLRMGGLLRKLLVVDLPPEAVAGPEGRVLLRPWQLTHDEYIAHGFDQLRQAAPEQPQVVAALLRVLRMLIDHVRRTGHPQHVPALRRQMELLLESVARSPGLHPDDLDRLELVADDSTDPADHTRRLDNPASSDRVAPDRRRPGD